MCPLWMLLYIDKLQLIIGDIVPIIMIIKTKYEIDPILILNTPPQAKKSFSLLQENLFPTKT